MTIGPDAGASAADVEIDRVRRFAGRGEAYYSRVFERIEQGRGVLASWNFAAFFLGPVWFGARALWVAFWLAFLVEIFATVLVGIGMFGDLGSDSIQRAERLAVQAAERLKAADAAAADGSTLAASMRASAEAIAVAAETARAAADAARANTSKFIGFGLGLLGLIHLAAGLYGNAILAKRFRNWRSDPSLAHGLPAARIIGVWALVIGSGALAVYRFAFSEVPAWLQTFPAATGLRSALSAAIDRGMRAIAEDFGLLFQSITAAINMVLNLMETCLVTTPWPIVMLVILILAWQISGPRVAVFSGAALAYLGFLGFWEKSMATVALLGTAAFLCVLIGVPVGVLCGRKRKVNDMARPVLDFMQTMPAFVYLIPVIAFFGIGKPPGIIATLIFGMPPVIRLTALGIAGVSPSVREAATAYGASTWFLLFKVDLPLATPSIMTGINQTLLMCLSMVVIASLIGAKGLGEDVLSALQYAAVGQGILAGIAILLCAMMLDRIVQGQRR